MITFVAQVILHCKCRHCKHEWNAFELPDRCAGCKRRTWNGEDKRCLDSLHSPLKGDQPPPDTCFRDVLDTLEQAKIVMEEVIQDCGPCDHKKKICVCEETSLLRDMNKHIEHLQAITGK